MFFVFNFQPDSQAECRRFDPGLPLQSFLLILQLQINPSPQSDIELAIFEAVMRVMAF